MKQSGSILVVLALVAAPAVADKVVMTQGISYANVSVRELDGFAIVFTTTAGRRISKPLNQIAVLQVRGSGAFNRAEQLHKAGKAAEAVEAYDQAHREDTAAWHRKLIRLRRLRALEQAGLIDQAVEGWINIVDENNGSAASLSIRPQRPSARGSKANEKGIALLESKLKTVEGNKGYAVAIRELLMVLHEAQGEGAKAADVASKLAKVSGPSSRPEANKSVAAFEALAESNNLRSLATAKVLLEQAMPDKAKASIEARLMHYGRAELPAALLLRGRADMQLAGKAAGRQRQRLLLRAGLDFMRVAGLFPNSVEAPEALLLAGKVHMELAVRNVRAAETAYRTVAARYPKTQAAKDARSSLTAMSDAEK